MRAASALTAKRAAILDRWFQEAAATYPADTARFLAQGRDQFHNPVGHALREGVARMFDGLLGPLDTAEVTPALDTIVRIRAVQEFAPSAAVAFVFALKRIVREEVPAAELGPELWAAIDAGVDRLGLLAFDIYMQCRERIFQIRVREIKESQLLAARSVSLVEGGQ